MWSSEHICVAWPWFECKRAHAEYIHHIMLMFCKSRVPHHVFRHTDNQRTSSECGCALGVMAHLANGMRSSRGGVHPGTSRVMQSIHNVPRLDIACASSRAWQKLIDVLFCCNRRKYLFRPSFVHARIVHVRDAGYYLHTNTHTAQHRYMMDVCGV